MYIMYIPGFSPFFALSQIRSRRCAEVLKFDVAIKLQIKFFC
jgi:hypothetical protein